MDGVAQSPNQSGLQDFQGWNIHNSLGNFFQPPSYFEYKETKCITKLYRSSSWDYYSASKPCCMFLLLSTVPQKLTLNIFLIFIKLELKDAEKFSPHSVLKLTQIPWIWCGRAFTVGTISFSESLLSKELDLIWEANKKLWFSLWSCPLKKILFHLL